MGKAPSELDCIVPTLVPEMLGWADPWAPIAVRRAVTRRFVRPSGRQFELEAEVPVAGFEPAHFGLKELARLGHP